MLSDIVCVIFSLIAQTIGLRKWVQALIYMCKNIEITICLYFITISHLQCPRTAATDCQMYLTTVWVRIPPGACEKVTSDGVRRRLSPFTPVSPTNYNWLVMTQPLYGRKSDETEFKNKITRTTALNECGLTY